MTTFNDFLAWEAHTRDTIDVKKIYIDMAGGDILAGVALSEIVFWNLPNPQGETKLRVKRDGYMWIASARYQWWERCRMTPRQSDRALKILKEAGLVVTERYKWNNSPTTHIRIVEDVFLVKWNQLVSAPLKNPFSPNGENARSHQTVKTRISPNGEIEITDPLNLVTETTTEITTETTESQKIPATPGNEKPIQPHIAIIDAYWAGLPGGKPVGEDYPRHAKVAVVLANDEQKRFTPENISRFMAALYDPKTEVWDYKKWHNRPVPLEELSKLLPVWLVNNPPPRPPKVYHFPMPAWRIAAGLEPGYIPTEEEARAVEALRNGGSTWGEEAAS